MRALRPLAALVMFTLAVSVACAPAQGHAIYLSSDPQANSILPAPPGAVTVRVTEQVSPGSASVLVTNAAGAHFERNATRISTVDARVVSTDVAALDPGVYTVIWRVTSADDGHPSAGAFAFCVQNLNGTCPGSQGLGDVETGATNSPVPPAEVALRAGSYVAAAAAVGAAAVLVLVWRPSLNGLSDRGAAAGRSGMRWLLLWGGGNAVALSAYSAAWLAWSLAQLSDAEAGAAFGESAFIQSLATRAVLAGALGALLFALWRQSNRGRRGTTPLWALLLALALGVAVVGAIAASSHAAARGNASPMGALADGAHVLFVALWVGGLFSLLVAARSLRGPHSALLARRVYTRFSKLALVSVVGVLGAGALLSILQVGSVENLTTTPFGLVVLGKLCLVAPMVALGAHNRFVSLPRMSDPTAVVEAAGRAGRNVRYEAAMGAVVLALAGLLTALVPSTSLVAPSVEPTQFLLSQVQDGIKVDMEVFPPPVGPREYIVSVLLSESDTGALYLNSTRGTATFVLTNSTLPPIVEAMSGPHDNHYFVNSTALSQPGQWRVDIRIERTDGFDIIAPFYVNIREVAPSG